MIKIPFSRTAAQEDGDKPSLAFAQYCRNELERRRDSGRDFNEERFAAAVDLAVRALRAREEKEGSA